MSARVPVAVVLPWFEEEEEPNEIWSYDLRNEVEIKAMAEQMRFMTAGQLTEAASNGKPWATVYVIAMTEEEFDNIKVRAR